MKVTKYLMFALATFMLLSCSKDDTDVLGNDIGVKNVTVKIATLQSKAQENHVPTGTITAIEDAVILFHNGSGGQVFSHELTADEIRTLTAAPTAGSITIGSVPASASKIAIVANYKACGQGTSYSGVNGTSTIDVANLHPATGVAKVVMYGDGTISGTAVGGSSLGDNTYPAAVTVSPIASRLEVSGIAADTTAGGPKKGEIKSYKLVGVFVPNHYPTGTIAGSVGASATGTGTLVKPTAVTYYTGSFPLTSGTGILNDYNATELILTESLFGYNMFPAVNASNLPNVVVAVRDVMYISDDSGSESLLDGGGLKYITITDYFTDAAKNTPLTQFKNGNVYGIESLLFGLKDLGDEPYTKAKNVAVTISITPWTYQQIYPGI